MRSHTINITALFSGVLGLAMLAGLAFVAPHHAHAQSSGLTNGQIDAIVGLLKSFNADPSVISDVENTLRGTSNKGNEDATSEEDENESTGISAPGRTGGLPDQANSRAKDVMQCLKIGRILRAGDQGSQVERVQTFLKRKGYFDHDEATGYFGRITQEAIQRFQAAQGIVNSGSPETTGFGQVGPRTREALAQASCLKKNNDEEETEEESEEDDDDTATSTDTDDDNGASTSTDES